MFCLGVFCNEYKSPGRARFICIRDYKYVFQQILRCGCALCFMKLPTARSQKVCLRAAAEEFSEN